MPYAPLALGFAFLALGLVFLAQGRKDPDELKARNARFAGSMMLVTGTAFLIAAAIRYFGD